MIYDKILTEFARNRENRVERDANLTQFTTSRKWIENEGLEEKCRNCLAENISKRVALRVFVMWRIGDDRIVERWASVMPMHEISAAGLKW